MATSLTPVGNPSHMRVTMLTARGDPCGLPTKIPWGVPTLRATRVGHRPIWLGPWRKVGAWFQREELDRGQVIVNAVPVSPRRESPLVAEPRYAGFCPPPPKTTRWDIEISYVGDYYRPPR